jgi:HEAT repeat protein
MYRRAGGQQDYLIRMIQQAGEVLRRLRGRAAEGAPAVELIDTARSAQAALFGERAEMLQRLDAASAVFLIGDDEAVRLWIELLREEAAAHRAGGDAESAARVEQRALLLERALPTE